MVTKRSVKTLYGLAVYTLILEFFYPFNFSFLNPESYVTKALVIQTKGLSSWFELWALFTILIYITWFVFKLSLKGIFYLFFYFRPALREEVKEHIRKRREEQKLKGKAQEKASPFFKFAYVILWPLMIINCSIFNREEGTPLVDGAVQRFHTIAQKYIPIYLGQLTAFLVLMILVIFVVIRAYIRGPTQARAPTSVEEGLPEETWEVKSGLYATTTTYIEATIINEKLVDIDEPVPTPPKPVTAPVDLL